MKVILDQQTPLEVKTCRSCGARIVWAVTEAGKRMPVDVEPSTKGNLLLWAETSGFMAGATFIPPYRVKVADLVERVQIKALWTTHLDTCPAAIAHRAGKGAQP